MNYYPWFEKQLEQERKFFEKFLKETGQYHTFVRHGNNYFNDQADIIGEYVEEFTERLWQKWLELNKLRQTEVRKDPVG
jgi:hypothetical protein